MKQYSIGCDIEKISRFKNKSLENDIRFLQKIFTDNELKYCYSNKNYAQHLCARFCAKEAAIKALSEYNINDIFYHDIEITNKKSGAPTLKIKKYPDLEIKVTISHCTTYAIANVLIIKENL